MEEKSFKVLYAKAGTKKRKAFSDGMLRIKAGPPPTHIITLTGEDGCELGKRTERGQINFKVGTEVPFGSFVLQIDEEVVDYGPALRVMPIPQSVAPNQPAKLSRFTKQQVGAPKIGELRAESIVGKTSEHDSFWNEEETTAVSAVPPELPRPLAPPVSSSSSSFRSFPSHQRTAPPNLSSAIEQDPSLMKLMRPHQVTGADFLISRLLGQALDSSAQALSGSAEITGAILADEVSMQPTEP